MSLLREIGGVDVSDFQVVELTQSAILQIDLHLYPPERTHFLIHAMQFQHQIPSEQSMLRSERRNKRKEPRGNGVGMIPFSGGRKFVVPNKYGPQPIKPIKIKRRVPKRRVQLSPQSFSSLSHFPQIGMAGQIPVFPPSPIVSIRNMPGMQIMANSPPSNVAFPPGFPVMGGINPPINHPSLQPVPMSASLPWPSVGIPSWIQSVLAAKARAKPLKQPKQQTSAFKVKSPEQIILKCVRTAYREELEKLRNDEQPHLVDKLKEEIPIYFQKKKANQKRRRLEKHELIKKHRKELVKIYGSAVFRKGWPISRQEIKEALGLKEEEKEISLEGIQQMMREPEVNKASSQSVPQNEISSIEVPQQTKEEKGEDQKKNELELILLQKISQLVFTN